MPLLYPLQVRVAIGDLPIDGVEVIFKIEKNDIEYNDDILSISENINTSPGANLVEEVKIPTDNQGLAKCYWQLGKKSTSNKHRVRAHIENNEDQQVWFNANLNNTDFTEGIRIENVFLKRDVLAKRVLKGNVLRKDVQQQLVNDAVIEITDLWKGISIQCNQIIKPNSIQNRDEIKADINPICYVTLEIPYSIKTILFYLPLKIPATVDIDKENGRVINWKPVHDFKKIIIQPVNKINKKNPLSPTTHLLAHLTIKGNYIYDVNRQFILDGESFSKLNGTRSIEMPSGDGRKGGDFWMWFWINLKKEPIKPFGNNILKVGPNG
jgi:hypothetical protein